jgi:membrane protein YqaA with SNARE-associated domain
MKNKKQKLVIIRTVGFMIMIIVGYLFLKGSRHSKLAGYFVYMSVACSIIPLPSPPYVIGMGKIFNPLLIAFLGAFGNIIAAFFEYYFITWLFSRNELQQKVEANKYFQRLANLFNRAGFSCILFTGFSPVPFDPFHFTAILTRYSILKYLLAIFIGRYPRYYLLALLGDSFQIHNQYLIFMLIALVLVPIIIAFILKRYRAIGYKSKASVA